MCIYYYVVGLSQMRFQSRGYDGDGGSTHTVSCVFAAMACWESSRQPCQTAAITPSTQREQG